MEYLQKKLIQIEMTVLEDWSVQIPELQYYLSGENTMRHRLSYANSTSEIEAVLIGVLYKWIPRSASRGKFTKRLSNLQRYMEFGRQLQKWNKNFMWLKWKCYTGPLGIHSSTIQKLEYKKSAYELHPCSWNYDEVWLRRYAPTYHHEKRLQ